jgi:hypothetical protein
MKQLILIILLFLSTLCIAQTNFYRLYFNGKFNNKNIENITQKYFTDKYPNYKFGVDMSSYNVIIASATTFYHLRLQKMIPDKIDIDDITSKIVTLLNVNDSYITNGTLWKIFYKDWKIPAEINVLWEK